MTSNQKKIGIAIIAAIICAAAFYFMYWTKTPTYSLGIIRDSIQKHDVTTFEKHVDMDTLYNKGFDDACVALDKMDGANLMSNPLLAGFIQTVKPAVVSELKTKTISIVKGEEDTQPAQKPANNADKMALTIKNQTGMNSSTFKSASVISQENNEATVSITLYNSQIEKDFELKVKMSKLDDGTWKVKEVTNLVDFLVDIDASARAKLAELNKPIQEEIQKAVFIFDSQLKIGNSGDFYFPQYYVDCQTTIKNISEQPIEEMIIKYTIFDTQNALCAEVEQKYARKSLAPNDEMTFKRGLKLNELMENHKKIVRDGKSCNVQAEVSYIKFKDNTTLKLLDKIPQKSADEKK